MALVRVQAHVRAKRARIAFEYEKDQWRQIQNKQRGNPNNHAKEIEQHVGWCDSVISFEEMQEKLMKRKEAAEKRERLWAYALTRQWQAKRRQQSGQAHGSSAEAAAAVIQQHRDQGDFEPDRSSGNWAWEWLEKWSRVRPWEKRFLDFDLKDGIKIVPANDDYDDDEMGSKMRTKKKKEPTIMAADKKSISPVSKKISKPVNRPINNVVESRSRSNPKEGLASDKDLGSKRLSLPGPGIAQRGSKQVPRTTVAAKKIIPDAKVNKGHERKPSRLSSLSS